MNAEEPQVTELVADRCEECGVKLTVQEMQAVLENGGPALCTVHAAEVAPLPPPEEEPAAD